MYLLVPFILQNFESNLRAHPELWGCAIFGTKMTLCCEQNIFGTNHYYYFHLPIGPFHCAKFKKVLTADPELSECTIFGSKMVDLPQTFLFFWKIINIILIYLLATFIVQNVKKIIPVDPVMRMRNFWAQNGPLLQMRIFFRKPVNVPCFFHSCLSRCQKSKSDINLLVKCWRLKNTEISLAKLENQIFPKHAVFAEC